MTELTQSTNINYYEILGVSRQATIQDICKAYRQIALIEHPSLDHPNKNQSYHKFCQASEAFDVLYDNVKREVYDEHGDQVLKEGLIKNGQLVGKYQFTSDPEQIFEKFFGSRNVYDHLLDLRKGDEINHPIFANQYSDSRAKGKVQNLIVELNCTLTQLFNGCTKTVTYGKKVLSQDGQNSVMLNETKTVEVRPGSCQQNPIVFVGQGHHQPGYPVSDLIFQIKEKNQKNFKRKGDNLHYEASISLMDAIDSKTISITQLNGKIIEVAFDQIINPQTERVIEGKGMPRNGKSGRGDLIVSFDIEFPEELSLEKKRQVVELLKV